MVYKSVTPYSTADLEVHFGAIIGCQGGTVKYCAVEEERMLYMLYEYIYKIAQHLR